MARDHYLLPFTCITDWTFHLSDYFNQLIYEPSSPAGKKVTNTVPKDFSVLIQKLFHYLFPEW